MGTRKIDKQLNHSHGPTQTKQQVGQCIIEALLVHEQVTGKHELTRLTTAQTWRKPPPSPLQYTLCLATRPAPKCLFVLRLPSESPEIPKIGILATLEAHNFLCKASIEVMSQAKLQPSSRAFQQYVALHLHVRQSGRFLIFNGWKSNWQFDSQPFSWP